MAPMNDSWADIRRAFPVECDRCSEILEYIRAHPGCRSSQIRSYLGCDGAGLFRVLIEMHKEGAIILERGMGGLRIPDDQTSPSDGMISTEPTAKSGQMGSA